jgi:predicted alpha-1,6-mannanase (GH76 family)
MRRSSKIHIALSLAVSLLCGCALQSANNRRSTLAFSPPVNTYLEQSTDAIQSLQGWYTPSTGLYQSTGWWNSANAITVLVDYARIKNTKQYTPVFENTFIEAQKTNPGFMNNFYDDEGWWALAWIDAYDLTRNTQYLSMAESIFADLAGGWDDTCGGGIWWSKDRRYKNAIANELFLSVAAHLANRTSGNVHRRYLNWGKKEWTWFLASGLINEKGLVNDGLSNSQGKAGSVGCVNNGRTTWSYNQGVVLGGLVELSSSTHDLSLPQTARRIARAAITLLVDGDGILHDSCEPNCGADGVQFKGIFVRNLVLLDKKFPRPTFKSFVDTNADSVWKNAQGKNFQLGQNWSGPFNAGNAGSQTSALDVLVGAAMLQNTN